LEGKGRAVHVMQQRRGAGEEVTHASPSSTSASSSPPARAKSSSSMSDMLKDYVLDSGGNANANTLHDSDCESRCWVGESRRKGEGSGAWKKDVVAQKVGETRTTSSVLAFPARQGTRGWVQTLSDITDSEVAVTVTSTSLHLHFHLYNATQYNATIAGTPHDNNTHTHTHNGCTAAHTKGPAPQCTTNPRLPRAAHSHTTHNHTTNMSFTAPTTNPKHRRQPARAHPLQRSLLQSLAPHK
jgi:hypothetical protein